MADVKSVELLNAVLREIDARLKARPGETALRYDRARCLERLGRRDDAIVEYRRVLERMPAHRESLKALGTLLLGAGDRAGALDLFRRAVAADGADGPSHANYAYTLLAQGALTQARLEYEAALGCDPKLAIAHHGLAEVLEHLGDFEGAERHRALGIANRPITALRYLGAGTPVRVLLIGSAEGGNLVMASHIDNRTFQTYALVMEQYTPQLALPEHDLVFNAIGEADRCGPALEAMSHVLSRIRGPLVNHPDAVLATRRAENAARLGLIEGVRTPKIVRSPRALLEGKTGPESLVREGWRFPLLLRSPGYHTGQHFVMVEDEAGFEEAVASLPGDELFVIEYLDVRGPDGKVRKYRAMFVDGTIYPLHLAVSHQWKVHYFSADMSDAPEHRAEDEAFLRDMPAALGERAMRALASIGEALGLEYAGVDFGLDAQGNVVVFEANASMVVPRPGPEAIWAYRRAPVERVLDAVRAMMLRRARPSSATARTPNGD